MSKQQTQQSSSGSGPELHYLNFIYNTADSIYSTGGQFYEQIKQQLPGQIKQNVNGVENFVKDNGGPYFNFGQDFSIRLLKDADYRVGALSQLLQGYRGEGEKLLGNMQQRRDQLLEQLQDGVNKAKANNPELANRLQKQIDDLRKVPKGADEQSRQILEQINQTWGQLKEDPRVAKVIESIQPQIEQGQKMLADTQSRILADQRYANLFNFLSFHINNIFSSKTAQDVKATIKPYANQVVSEERQANAYNTVVKNISPNVTPTNDPKTGQTKQ